MSNDAHRGLPGHLQAVYLISNRFGVGWGRVSLGFEHLPGMGFVLEGQGLGSDEGSFGALQSLLEPPVSISYHTVDMSTR